MTEETDNGMDAVKRGFAVGATTIILALSGTAWAGCGDDETSSAATDATDAVKSEATDATDEAKSDVTDAAKEDAGD